MVHDDGEKVMVVGIGFGIISIGELALIEPVLAFIVPLPNEVALKSV